MLPLVAPALGWVTHMQSNYGMPPEYAAGGFAGNASVPQGGFEAMGAYWHFPLESENNRGLGGGIQWAWDDELCKATSDYSVPLEDQFDEDFIFGKFITCKDIRAAMHRAF